MDKRIIGKNADGVQINYVIGNATKFTYTNDQLIPQEELEWILLETFTLLNIMVGISTK